RACHQGPEVRLRQIGSRDEPPGLVGCPRQGARSDGGAQKRRAHRATACSYQYLARADAAVRERRRRGADIARVAQLSDYLIGGYESGAELDQLGIAMHQHQVEATTDNVDDFSGALRIASTDKNIPHRA